MLNSSVIGRSSQASRLSLGDTSYSSYPSSIFEGSISQATARTSVLNLNIFDGGADHAPQLGDVFPNIGGFVHAEPAPFPDFFMPQQQGQGLGHQMLLELDAANIAHAPNLAMQQQAADAIQPQSVIEQASASQPTTNPIVGLISNLRERISANSAAENSSEHRDAGHPVSDSDDHSTLRNVSMEVLREQDVEPVRRGSGGSIGGSIFSRLRRFMRRRSS